MGGFYELQRAPQPPYTGSYNARHKWALPGLQCPECGSSWAGSATGFPSVDLSSLPERGEFERARPEPYNTWVRLRELVRPLVPPGTQLLPGASFGPLVGTAAGTFGQLFLQNSWTLLMRREALERMQAEGMRGLTGYPTELRFRQKTPPELREVEILPCGHLHPDCLSPDRAPPCAKCGWFGDRLPEDFVLDAASLPAHTDLFRLTDFETILISTERFRESALRLGLDGVAFREVPVR